MGFAEAVKTCFGKYSDFRGRAPRSEYWFWFLFIVLIFGGGFALAAALGNLAKGLFVVLGLLALLGLFLPSLAVAIRRLHDINSSGWWYLLTLLPYVGGLIMLVWYCIKGTAGENRFGPDPLNPVAVEAFD